MCGVAGIYNYGDRTRPIDSALLSRMTDTLAHRGPDGRGIHIQGPIGLGHRRLAIVDRSAAGHQPMLSANGCVLSYNGEIYNHHRYRSRLQSKGVVFRGSSDTETLLNVLCRWGTDALEDLAGIFSLAFWDPIQHCLLLARDPLGVKQLYYHDDGQRILFASEIKALLQCSEIERRVNKEAVNQYLHFHTPLFEHTFFAGIHQLQPGEWMRVTATGGRKKTFWRLQSLAQHNQKSIESTVSDFQQEFAEIVSSQLMSDVPVGVFLSGGIDSSTVAAFAKKSGQRLPCFGVHFSDQGVVDERPYQESVAKALGLDLNLTTVDGSSFADDLHRLTYYQDQPVIGAALIPMYHVSKLAASQVTVCLGGQAADELFAGYARYALAHPAKVAASWLRRKMSTVLPGRTAQAAGGVGGNLTEQFLEFGTLARLWRAASKGRTWHARYFENFVRMDESVWLNVFDAELVSRSSARNTFMEHVTQQPTADPADRLLHWDMQTYLPGLFQQDDRMSMANSLESRVPFADPRLVRLAFSIPFSMKMRDGASKWILRKAVSEMLPSEILNRRKVGFDTPVERWMRDHKSFVRETLCSQRARERGFMSMTGVESILNNIEHPYWFNITWKLLSVELWASVFIDNETPPLNSGSVQ